MPCFAQKRLSSSPPPLLGARPPPNKRIKITHPSERPLSDPDVSPTPSGHPHRNASLALLSNADQTRLSPSPLTRCHAANEVCDSKPREYEHLAPEQMPQTLLSWNASHQLLHDEAEAQRASKSKSALVSGTSAAHATPEDVRYISPTTAFARSPSASLSLPLCPSEPVPPMAYISVAEPGPSTYYCSQLPPANPKAFPITDPLVAAPSRMSPSETDVLDYLYDGLEDSSYDFAGVDVLSQFDFSAASRLSDMQDYDPDVALLVARSPISRSMSRSSFDSSSYMESSSPYDYPTPVSDSSVATPAPNEAGWVSAFCDPLFGQEVPFGLEAKGKEPQHSYVHDFSGSAPLSPNAFSTYSFDAFPPASSALPPNASGSLTGARRHSEPANLAALQFPLFFQDEFLQIPPPPLPADAATLPIADNISPPSAGAPSSIAPHQTELPRPLEIKQPKPVRAYKPPILRADCQYDPKDFVIVRRHSEPIVALRELDVGSHLLLDASEEPADEADEPMAFEGAEDLYEGEESFDDLDDEASMDGYLEGFDEVEQGSLGEPLFDPHWSWIQPGADSSSATSQPCPMTNLFSTNIDWTNAFAGPPAASTARLDGLFHH